MPYNAQRLQKKDALAQTTQNAFNQAWKYAGINITASLGTGD